MLTPLMIGASVVAIAAGLLFRHRRSLQARRKRLDEFAFPALVGARVRKAWPHLTPQQTGRVVEGLRQFFHIAMMADRRMVSMPSKAADEAWHAFILSTRDYRDFCRSVLGRFLHHTPAEAMRMPAMAQDGIKRAWKLCCGLEGIDPARPDRLPLLFALDAMLEIPGGFRYTLDCRDGSGYCASDIGCTSNCGSSSGNGGSDASGGSHDAGSDGGDGSGCGSGCGGGGD